MKTIWKGSISFGLANIPVRLFSAVESSAALDLDMLHKDDLSPIRYAKICKAEGKEIPFSEIVKGYKHKGGYVTLDEADFKKADVKKTSTISIVEFVKKEEIPEIFYEKPYFLSPDKGAEMPYALLREALKRSEKVGVAKFVLRNREHLSIISPVGNAILLNQLRFAEELRSSEDLELPTIALEEEQIDIAMALIEQMTHKFIPTDFKDTYTAQLRKLISEKASGKEIRAPKYAPQEVTQVNEVMQRLRESLKEQRQEKVK